MGLEQYTAELRPEIEVDLQQFIERSVPAEAPILRSMLAYHMGWEGEGSGPEAQGKRIRPLLVLLSTIAAGGDWRAALPAATAVELIHNFSLIHDDIQDQSELRRGRPTVWVKWGKAQAINAGDLMFTLAQLSMLRIADNHPADVAAQAMKLLNQTCVELTRGQYLDMANEDERTISLEAYWSMIDGKTAALLACCCELGALSAQADGLARQSLHHFGRSLGLAFQVLDDWLGVWGDVELLGKSIESDLVAGKKTLPVLYAISQNGEFARRWAAGNITREDVPDLSAQLIREGARDYTQSEADRLTADAHRFLKFAGQENEGVQALDALAGLLLRRQR